MNGSPTSFAAAAAFGHKCTPDSAFDKFLNSLEMSLLIMPSFRHPSVVLIRKTSDYAAHSVLENVWSLATVCTQPLSLIVRLSSTKMALRPAWSLSRASLHQSPPESCEYALWCRVCYGISLSVLSDPPHQSTIPSTVHLDEGCAVLTGLGVNSIAPTESQLTHGCSCITQLAATHVLLEELKCVKHLLFCNAELLLQSWIALIKAPF